MEPSRKRKTSNGEKRGQFKLNSAKSKVNRPKKNKKGWNEAVKNCLNTLKELWSPPPEFEEKHHPTSSGQDNSVDRFKQKNADTREEAMNKKRRRSIDTECTSYNKVILEQRESRGRTNFIPTTEETFKVSQLVRTALTIGEAHGVIIRDGKGYLVRDLGRSDTPYPQHLQNDKGRRW